METEELPYLAGLGRPNSEAKRRVASAMNPSPGVSSWSVRYFTNSSSRPPGTKLTSILTGDGPCASVLDRVPLVMLTRRGKTAQFACVLEPVVKGKEPAVTTVETGEATEGIRVTIRNGSETDTITLRDDNTFTVRTGGKAVLEGK